MRDTDELTILKETIEALYTTFAAYPLRHPVEGCPCCVTPEDQERHHFWTRYHGPVQQQIIRWLCTKQIERALEEGFYRSIDDPLSDEISMAVDAVRALQ